MLRSLNEVMGYKLWARDGHMGKVHDLYFGEDEWKIRYLVVHTGAWILGRKVLVSVEALGQPVWGIRIFPVNLTRHQVKTSPKVDTSKPISRQYEEKLHHHYQWASYWTAFPGSPAVHIPKSRLSKKEETAKSIELKKQDSHLRGTRRILGYKIKASGEQVGSVTDFIFADEDWSMRYFVLDINDIPSTKKPVLIDLATIEGIHMVTKTVSVNIDRNAVQDIPAYDPTMPINRQIEES